MFKNKPPKHTMAEVLELFGEEYYNNNTISFEQHKVISNILNCRTSVMGEHWYKCDQCDHKERVYNSCGDRHCPSCQGVNKERCSMLLSSHETGDNQSFTRLLYLQKNLFVLLVIRRLWFGMSKI